MLAITDSQKRTAIVNGQDVQITQTMGSLDTLSFTFTNDKHNYLEGEVIAPFSTISVPEVDDSYLLQTYNTDKVGDYIQYSVTAIQKAKMFHYHYINGKFGMKKITKKVSKNKTQTKEIPIKVKLVDVLAWLFKGTEFKYVLGKGLYWINQQFIKDGLGPGYADELLASACKLYGVEYYWHGNTCHIEVKLGDKNKFVFVDNVNCSKIAAQEDDSVITTYASGSATTKKTVTKTIVKKKKKTTQKQQISTTIKSTYTSPLVKKKQWPIIPAQPFTNTATEEGDEGDAAVVMTQKELDDKVKSLVHDYPNIQYTVDGVNFKKYSKYYGNIKLGDSGFLRTRQGIDVETRVSSITYYPQDVTKDDTVTFGNLILDTTSYLAHQRQQLEKYEVYYSDMMSSMSDISDSIDGISDDYSELSQDFDDYRTANTESISNLEERIKNLSKISSQDKDDSEKDNP